MWDENHKIKIKHIIIGGIFAILYIMLLAFGIWLNKNDKDDEALFNLEQYKDLTWTVRRQVTDEEKSYEAVCNDAQKKCLIKLFRKIEYWNAFNKESAMEAFEAPIAYFRLIIQDDSGKEILRVNEASKDRADYLLVQDGVETRVYKVIGSNSHTRFAEIQFDLMYLETKE
jgi:hypothetical protein